jgi:hypothetical protein
LEAGIEPSKLMFLFNKEQLYEFELKQPKYEPLIKTLLRSYGGLFDSFVAITERELAYRVKNSVGNVVSYLEFLHQQGILDYRPQTELPRLLFTMSRMDARYLALSPQNYAIIDPAQIAEKNVLVVDDVITTGATIESVCKYILSDARPHSLSVVAAAYTI